MDTNEGLWKPCHTNCATFSKEPTAANENCDTCKNGKYTIEGDTTGKCTDTRPDGYYLDGTTKEYKKCYSTCSSCLALGTLTSNICTSCKTNNYEFQDITGKCDSTDTSPNKNYYLDTIVTPNRWKKCYSTCATCSTGGNTLSHNCLTCISGYKKKEGTTDCVYTLPLYYYDAGTEYKKCDPSCETCHGAPLTSPTANTNCITCRTNLYYYPYDTTDSAKNCVNTVPSGYYKDTTTTPPSYKKCNDSCLEWNGPSNSITTNCKDNQCASTYYVDENLLSNCLKNNSLPEEDSNANKNSRFSSIASNINNLINQTILEEDCVIQIYQTNYPPNTDSSISSIDLSRCELFLRREKGIAVEEHL